MFSVPPHREERFRRLIALTTFPRSLNFNLNMVQPRLPRIFLYMYKYAPANYATESGNLMSDNMLKDISSTECSAFAIR